jgi:tRNA(Ile)-lysidine synthase
MLSQFELHLRNSFPSIFNEKVLIAISGGVDSMVLANLCLKLNLKISLAHCNFNLRGSESKSDEDFIFDYGKSNDLIVY